jgi:hypothetical protein
MVTCGMHLEVAEPHLYQDADIKESRVLGWEGGWGGNSDLVVVGVGGGILSESGRAAPASGCSQVRH